VSRIAVSCGVVADGQAHDGDFLPLRDDDFLRQAPQLLVLAVAQVRHRHVDRALVMRRHHRDEVAVDVAARLHGHVVHHLVHRRFVRGEIRGFRRRLLGPGERRDAERENPNEFLHR